MEATTPKEYYKRAIVIPLLDHLATQMDIYWSLENVTILSSPLFLAPKLLVSQEHDKLKDALPFYADDLRSPQVANVELLRWRRKWLQHDQSSLPGNTVKALAECDHDFYPNTHQLLRILRTLPISSAECERSFSTLRRLKTALRATVSSERESSLALMKIYYDQNIKRLILVDLSFHECDKSISSNRSLL